MGRAGCVFCRIARGEVPAHVVHEDDLTVAFLDSHPIRAAHLQIIPRDHHPFFVDLPPETASRVIHVGQPLARAIKALCGVDRVAFLFTGGDVPHVHAHLVPMHESTDITSRLYIAEAALTFRPMPTAADQDLEMVAARLRASIAAPDP